MIVFGWMYCTLETPASYGLVNKYPDVRILGLCRNRKRCRSSADQWVIEGNCSTREMKLLKITDIEIVKYCQNIFRFDIWITKCSVKQIKNEIFSLVHFGWYLTL